MKQKSKCYEGSTIILGSDFNENDLYQVEKIILEEKKENLNDVRVRLNANRKNRMLLKI